MRPLELRLRNFRSFFGDGHTFDFRDRHLVGIVGPIGSGKSSVLDAIAFALYGRTPRINRGTKSLIHQRATEAHVALKFEVDGEIWEAVRMLRAKGQSQHALYLYADDSDDAEKIDQVVMEGEVNERIEALLGFDYDTFGRSVLLAQGQFAEFLNSRPAERDKVLKGVFGHERIDAMRDLAKAMVKDTDHEREKLGIRLEQTEAALGRLGARRQALEAQVKRLAALELLAPNVDELNGKASDLERRLTEQKSRIAELARLAEKLPDAGWSEDAIATAERARAGRAALATDLEDAHGRLSAAEAAVKSDDVAARAARINQANELLVRLESLDGAAATSAKFAQDVEARVASAAAAGEKAAGSLTTAETSAAGAQQGSAAAMAALQGAEQTLLDARHADMASSLREELEAGHVCPVCEQSVHKIPDRVPAVDTAKAELNVESARKARDQAEGTHRKASASFEAAKADQASAASRLDELRKELGNAQSGASDAAHAAGASRTSLEELVGAGDAHDRLKELRGELAALEGEVNSARKAVEDVRRSLDQAIATEQESARGLGDLRTQLVALAVQLSADAELPEDDPGALRDALIALREGWQRETKDLQDAVDADRAEHIVVVGRVKEMLEEHQVMGSLGEALAEVRAEVKVNEAEIDKDEALVSSSSELLAERDRLVGVAGSYRRLASDLTDAKFIRFLLDEERAALAELGSEHFQRLSSGRYRFSDDGTFEVVDLTAADAVRKADSLSGGETFLASLGLALGLSEMVGRTGGRLDAFFLDEGFGSLDTEHLDLAMEGIEALITDHPHRLVVVVSHVPELRHRIEDLIVLDRDSVTGDSIRVSGATG